MINIYIVLLKANCMYAHIWTIWNSRKKQQQKNKTKKTKKKQQKQTINIFSMRLFIVTSANAIF